MTQAKVVKVGLERESQIQESLEKEAIEAKGPTGDRKCEGRRTPKLWASGTGTIWTLTETQKSNFNQAPNLAQA